MEILTFEQIVEMSDTDYDIMADIIGKELSKRVIKPKKPLLLPNHTTEQVLQYAKELKEYEEEMITYQNESTSLSSKKFILESEYQKFLCVCLLTDIDNKYWEKVFNYCQNNCESYNLHNKLMEINRLFE